MRLVLTLKAADRGHLGDAVCLGELKADQPVLQASQLGERPLCAEHDVLIDPADAGRIRSERRRHALRQALGGEVQIFEDAAARPVEVGAVLEYDIDEAHSEIGEAADDLGARHREERRRQGIGDLVLDHLRRLAGILGVDDDLRVREIGDGVERRLDDGPDPGSREKQRAKQHQYGVACREFDDAANDALAWLNAIDDLRVPFAAHAETNGAWLEATLAALDQNHLLSAAIDHGGVRHHHDRRSV